MIQLDCLNIARLTPGSYDAMYALASPQRQARANRCRNQADALRCIAGEMLIYRAFFSCHPHDSKPDFSANPYGKPYFPQYPDFHFNLSHSGDWVVLAWGASPVGVDVQQMEPERQAVARRFFTEDEQAWVFEDPTQQPDRFYRIWTGKESLLKYLGTGLNRPLDSFSVLSDSRLSYYQPDPQHCICLCAENTHRNVTHITEKDLLSCFKNERLV